MFKVGDKVKMKGEFIFCKPGWYPKNEFEIKCKYGSDYYLFNRNDYTGYDGFSYGESCPCGNHHWIAYQHQLELISSTEQNKVEEKQMNLQEKFTLAFKKEPEKTFRKLSITNGDDILTDEGAKVFLTWLLSKNSADFKKEVCDDMLAEQEKSK